MRSTRDAVHDVAVPAAVVPPAPPLLPAPSAAVGFLTAAVPFPRPSPSPRKEVSWPRRSRDAAHPIPCRQVSSALFRTGRQGFRLLTVGVRAVLHTTRF